MRIAAAAIAMAVVLASMTLGTRPAAAATLNAQIDALVDAFPGGTALWIADPALTQALYTRDADRKIIAASLYKLALLAEAEHQVDLGHLHYGDTMVIDQEDITDDGSFEGPGTEMTLDEALEAMITISDNGTAMHLWRMLGPAAVNAELARLGMTGFHIALDESEDNEITARAAGTFFTLLAKRQLVSPAASDRMLKRLERQQINDRIPAQLPEGTVVAHKTGNLVGVVHDAGLAFTPRGQRVIVALTWDTDDDPATEFIARVASTVYSAALSLPASARYKVPLEPQYVELGSALTIPVTVENTGGASWAASGPAAISLIWELRDAQSAQIARSAKPLPLGEVKAGGSVTVPLAVPATTRLGDAKLVIGLVDGSGRALSSAGVATATVPLRVHLPFVGDAAVRIPSLLHRREASLVEVAFTANAPARAEDHYLTLGWRLLDPATDRIVAQGTQQLGVLRTFQRVGTFFAPLVAPNVRGTYTLEYELRERGFIASVTGRKEVEVGAPRTYGGETGFGPPTRR